MGLPQKIPFLTTVISITFYDLREISVDRILLTPNQRFSYSFRKDKLDF
ncbi:hypothetical protein LEP1GSC125_3527 [Leptospira mayottensis 200901122]|uniref:Uncharacterized protein n=1 Tax=Leptospira mayottensis 200901122 TaxID=1193010 RepID=A0AA87SWI2_9LEPT|nr:hypothetical protein LEP1GSC125_3527 [Leptospira mayottensis 200901122]